MNLFKQSIPLQAIVILIATLALWIGAIVSPEPMTAPEGGAVLYGVVYRLLAGEPRLAAIIAMILIVAEAATFNVILVNNNLTPQTSLLPTLLFIICMSAPATTITPMVLVTGLMVACMYQLSIRGSLLTIPSERACAATALIGLSSMFYLPAALMMVSYMLVAINYRLYSWRDWIVMILGFAAPYIILATVLMFTEGFTEWWASVEAMFANLHLHVAKAALLPTLGCVVLLIVMLAGVVSVFSRSSESTVVWQKNAATVLYSIVGGICMVFAGRLFPTDMQLFAIAFTFGVSCLLTPESKHTMMRGRHKKEWIYTAILVLIFVAAIVC